jgi:hypothetical protein
VEYVEMKAGSHGKQTARVTAKHGRLLIEAKDTTRLDGPVRIASEFGNDLGEWTADNFPIR